MNNREFAERMLHYFRTAGAVNSEYKEELPSFVRFAHRVGTDMQGLRTRCAQSRTVAHAYEECRAILLDRVIDGALHKRYDASFAKFLLSDYWKEGEQAEEGDFSVDIVVREP